MQENEAEETSFTIDEEHAEQLEVMDKAVEESLKTDDLITKSAANFIAPETLLDKISDKITYFSGSYYFITGLALFIGLWMRFVPISTDPYPWVLLNLIISVICVLQTPWVLKSQWRTEAKDRDTNTQNYAINLKNEIQIKKLLDQHEEILKLLKDRTNGR